MDRSSSISGFYKLSPKERLQFVKEFAGLSDEECALLRNTGSLPLALADRMIENVIGPILVPWFNRKCPISMAIWGACLCLG